MSQPNSIDDAELEKLLDSLIKSLPPAVEDFFGVRIGRVKMSSEKKRKLLVEMRGLVSGLKVLETIKPPFASIAEWVDALDTLDRAMKPFLDPQERKMHFADYLGQAYLQLIDAPLNVGYLSKRYYKACIKEIDSISSDISQVQRQGYADKFFYQIGEGSDSGILAQALLVHVPKMTNYLVRPKRDFSKSTVDRLIRTYSELSGYYEKGLRLVIGMLEIVEGKEPSYPSLCKRSLSSNVNILTNSHPILTEHISVGVRNSIAHGSYYLHYHTKTIDFHEKNGKKVASWRFLELFKQCRKLSELTMVVLMAYYVFQARRWQDIWDAYCLEKSSKHKKNPAPAS